MANSPQAKKRARQGEARRRHNASFRSLVRTSIKKVDSAIETGDHSKASEAYNSAVPIIDRMADKGMKVTLRLGLSICKSSTRYQRSSV